MVELWFSYTVIIAVVIYMIFILYMGVWGFRKGTATTFDYFIASKGLGSIVIGCTIAAANFSAFTVMGYLGWFYAYGVERVWSYAAVTAAGTLALVWVGTKLATVCRDKNYVTPADYFAERIGSNIPMRILVGLIICIYFSMFYVVLQLKGMGWGIQALTGGTFTFETGVIFTAIFMAVVVVLGGLRGVAVSDVVNFAVIVIGMGGVIIGVYVLNPNIGLAFDNAALLKPDLAIPPIPVLFVIAANLAMIHWCGWPHLMQRWFAAAKTRGIWLGGTVIWFTNVIVVCFGFLLVPAFINAYPTYTGAADQIGFIFAGAYLNPVVSIALLIGMIGAAISTAAALILMCGSIVSDDLIKQIWPKINPRKLSIVARIATLIITIITVIVTFVPLGMLVTIAMAMTYPGYGILAINVIASLWWRRYNKYGAIASMIVGIAFGVYGGLTQYGITFGSFIVAPIVMITTAAVLIVVCLITPPPEERILKKFGFKA